jgi:outer membrane PBP1 activator LpoA protein
MSKRSKHILRSIGKPLQDFRRSGMMIGRAVRWSHICLLGWVLGGCATTPLPEASAPEQPAQETSASAAVLMERAARAAADRAARLYLQAAWAYLDADDAASAESAYQALEPGWLAEDELADFRLLTASLAIRRGDTAAAHKAIDRLPRELQNTPRAQRVKSALCEAESDPGCAVAYLVLAAGDDPAENETVWRLLGESISLTSIQGEYDRQGIDLSGSGHLAGWRALQAAVAVPFSIAESQSAVRNWLAAHPEHPAALIPPAAITGLLEQTPASPRRIALLLPMSGPLARAGEAVRDGFIAASLMAGATGWLNVSVYDSAAEPLPVTYERILADGTELLIGPLQKSAVTELNGLNPDLPVLALNYLDEDVEPSHALNQFGLAIEDEAATIAVRLERDGIERALLFHNYEDWSLRARRALTDSAKVALTVQPFTDLRTITESVGTAMHVESSQKRRDELARLLGTELEFLPRAREDVDAVVALIDNTEANALVPALRFHFADHLPVYASSQITRRVRDGQLNELSGFRVSELPYFLSGDPVFDVLAEPFDLAENPFASLMALGSDAFRIAERLQDKGVPLMLLGSTGLLVAHPDGRISRELAWGFISRGAVMPDRPDTPSGSGVGD